MNRFVIVDGLPYLIHGGKTFAVRWDDKGFTVGTEVKLASVPEVTLSELSVKAKCAGNLDSIKAPNEAASAPNEPFAEMSVAELKAYAKEHDIKLGSARTKDAIIDAIEKASV